MVGTLIGWYITNQFNVIYHGPNSNEIKKWIWYNREDDSYYTYETVPYVCPPLMRDCIKDERF